MTRTDRRWPLLVALLVGITPPVFAQPERHELGRRLKAFESAWDKAPRGDGHTKALAVLPKVTGQFFALQFGEAGRTLDEARRLVTGETPTEAGLWADSLYAVPSARLIDPKAGGKLTLTIRQFHPMKTPMPEDETAHVRLGSASKFAVALGTLPKTVDLALPRVAELGEDFQLAVYASGGGQRGALSLTTVSVIPGAAGRVAAMREAATAREAKAGPTVETATLLDRADLLTGLLEGSVPETDVPAQTLLAEADRVVKAFDDTRDYYTVARRGQFWLSIPVGAKARAPVRLLVPHRLDRTKPAPLVVALHGAGGSENLFFEGYGDGHIAKECDQRGWMLVAPRAGFLGAPPVAEIVAALSKRYPIDPKAVFLVGHSMGAGQAVELAQQSPGAYRALALLGGAARVRKPEALRDLPLFVGVGTKDQLAFAASQKLNKTLADAGAKNVTYREYPGVEHLVIVREALPDVFAQWDALLAK